VNVLQENLFFSKIVHGKGKGREMMRLGHSPTTSGTSRRGRGVGDRLKGIAAAQVAIKGATVVASSANDSRRGEWEIGGRDGRRRGERRLSHEIGDS
jgi:hypothetical protein